MGMGIHPARGCQMVAAVDHVMAFHRFRAHIGDIGTGDPDRIALVVTAVRQFHIFDYDIISHLPASSSFFPAEKASSRNPPYSFRASWQWQVWVTGSPSPT